MKTRKLLTAVISILAFAATNIQAQVPSYVPTNGLVGYWGFNGNANDQSGNGNNGTVNGATLTTDRNGNANSAYSFDGVSSFIELNNISGLIQTNGVSMSAWVLWNGTNGIYNHQYIFQVAPNPNGAITISDDGSLGINVANCNCINDVGVNTIISQNTWYHVVLTYDLLNGLLKMYLNGNLIGTSQETMHTYYSVNNNNSRFGNYYFNSHYFKGIIDDGILWNRALTQSEITQLYSSTESIQNLCTKTIQPYNVNVGDATHEGSTYAWSISPAAPNAIINGNGTNSITIDWANVPDGSYTLQAIETSIEGCISSAVRATINLATPTAPVAQPQTFCANATVANLVATGTNLQWYSVATGGTALDSGTPLASGIYYVSNNLGTCESQRTAVAITINTTVIPTFTQVASTCSGTAIMALPTISDNGITGTWSPAINNSETTTYTFTPDASQCTAPTTQTITITTPKITSRISFVAPVASLPNVIIGNQVWTNKNLDITTYRDGTPIPQVTDPTEWSTLTTGAWCYYNNDPANGAIYGKLYNWYAVAGIYDADSLNDPSLRKQLAPIGWHVPSDSEWTTLTTFLGGQNVAGGKMKEIGTSYWNSPNLEATNESGFTAYGGGFRVNNGINYYLGNVSLLWSSTEIDSSWAWPRVLNYSNGSILREGNSKGLGLSVRLIKD